MSVDSIGNICGATRTLEDLVVEARLIDMYDVIGGQDITVRADERTRSKSAQCICAAGRRQLHHLPAEAEVDMPLVEGSQTHNRRFGDIDRSHDRVSEVAAWRARIRSGMRRVD